jgi:hypothetical protein
LMKQFLMIRDQVLTIQYEKYHQQLNTQICKFTALCRAQHAACFGHLLWPSSGRCSLKFNL